MSIQKILSSPIEYLKGVGPQKGLLLRQELGISTFQDLLHHYPYRYSDRSLIININQIHSNTEAVQILGTIKHIYEEGTGQKSRLIAQFEDKTGKIDLVFFGGIKWMAKKLKENEPYLVYGKVNFFNQQFSIVQPEIESIYIDQIVGGLQPIYPSTQKLINRGITNRSFAKLTQQLFIELDLQLIPDYLPTDWVSKLKMISLAEALKWIHYPTNEEQKDKAIHRLKWDELFKVQLGIAQIRKANQLNIGYPFQKVGNHFNEFYNHHLPFELTNAQKKVIKEIRKDTASGNQMNRLLQGDVGSGKTIVALLSMLLAVDNGYQACLMAPTEILAQQHFQGISKALEALPIEVRLLTGQVKIKDRRPLLEDLKLGKINLLIGTHALLEETVQFSNLGLAIIDEQHRFGVKQRSRLWLKNQNPPHLLVMTATPIPRTLAMTLYGDLEISVIDELPPGRQIIKTIHRNENHRTKVLEFIRSEIDQGRQAYIVYPLIQESEKLDYESLLAGYEQVKIWFPESKYKIAMVHGKQDAELRERNMQRFIQGEAQLLVATTVIEVGVNVPNASVMMIESAERFGLSQLHQLRGRVGRGNDQSYCILLTGNKLNEESKKRMKIITSTSNGFIIAEQDLLLRGAGDIQGTQQSGAIKYKIADIVTDLSIIEETRKAAQFIMSTDPQLSNPLYQEIKELIQPQIAQKQWGKIS